MPVDLVITLTEKGADGVWRAVGFQPLPPKCPKRPEPEPVYNPNEYLYEPVCDINGPVPRTE